MWNSVMRLALMAMGVSFSISWAWSEDALPKGTAPRNAADVLGKTVTELESTKGVGKHQMARNAEGEFLSNLTYAEDWFELISPGAYVEYLVRSPENPVIHQITLNYVEPNVRTKFIEYATRFLGDPVQGESDPSAPSVYYATWIFGGVRYDLQDYGDRVEVYIGKALLSDNTKYKLPDDITVLQRALIEDGGEYEVLLLGMRSAADSPHFEKLQLLVRKLETYEGGQLFALPEGSASGYEPEIAVGDLTGDGVGDVLITSPTGGSGGIVTAVAYGLTKSKHTLLLDSNKTAMPTLTGAMADGYKASVAVVETKEAFSVDLSDRAKTYDGLGVYTNGKLQKPVELWGGEGYSQIRIVPGEGVARLSVVQELRGTSNADRVSGFESLLKWDGKAFAVERVELRK